MVRKDKIKSTESMIDKQKEIIKRDNEIKELKITIEYLEKDRNELKVEVKKYEQ
jgi:hypothetical protein